MDLGELVRIRPVTYDELESVFMSVQTRLQNTTTSYFMSQILIFLAVNLDSFSIQSRFRGVSLVFSLLATVAALHGSVPDLVSVVEIRHRMDLHEMVLTRMDTPGLPERVRRVRSRRLRSEVLAGGFVAGVLGFSALVFLSCWLLVPIGAVEEAVGFGSDGSDSRNCSEPVFIFIS